MNALLLALGTADVLILYDVRRVYLPRLCDAHYSRPLGLDGAFQRGGVGISLCDLVLGVGADVRPILLGPIENFIADTNLARC